MPAKPKKSTTATPSSSASAKKEDAASPKKPARKKLAPAKSAADVKVPVDAKLKAQWDKTLAAIEKAKGQGAEAFDELWEAVAKVVEHDPPLYVLGGYGSAPEFFEEVLKEKERTARRFIRVAKYATPQEEEKYGTTVLDAALSYVEATIGKPLSGPLPIAFERLRIVVTRDGKETRLPLAQVSAEEITKATRSLAAEKGKKPITADPVEEALRKAIVATAPFKAVRATVRGGAATFSGVPVSSIHAFGKALAGIKLPVIEPAPRGASASKSRATKKKSEK